ncbi:hypothetical protein V8G54_005609 [Vigna mungo]|uniref:Uncharacterized protein n=1 Tax=Vigna mungo TaxID=3915 RepID=A0AAQ3S5N7_VIGMU
MGRRLPVETLSFIHHPFIYLSFFAAGLAASMAIITALCSGFGRKASPPPPPPTTLDPTELSKESDTSPTSNTEEKDNNNNEENEKENEKEKGLPLPPALQQVPKDPFISDRMKRVTSERRAPLSLSIKMPRSSSVARNWDHKEEKIKGPKLKAEDSVWMKTIILGEKCVPDAEDDPVIFEGRGKRISAYHTKRYTATAVPTEPSFLDDASSPSLPENLTQDEAIISKA